MIKYISWTITVYIVMGLFGWFGFVLRESHRGDPWVWWSIALCLLPLFVFLAYRTTQIIIAPAQGGAPDA